MNGDYAGFLNDPTVPKLDRLPVGWSYAQFALTAPSGWKWAHNGVPLSSGKRRKALVKEGSCAD